MKKLWNRLYHGEPVFLIGFINTVLVTLSATGEFHAAVGWGAAVTTALGAWIARQKVTPNSNE